MIFCRIVPFRYCLQKGASLFTLKWCSLLEDISLASKLQTYILTSYWQSEMARSCFRDRMIRDSATSCYLPVSCTTIKSQKTAGSLNEASCCFSLINSSTRSDGKQFLNNPPYFSKAEYIWENEISQPDYWRPDEIASRDFSWALSGFPGER